jgi:hypothetical protein
MRQESCDEGFIQRKASIKGLPGGSPQGQGLYYQQEEPSL